METSIMNTNHQVIALAIYLGAFPRNKLYGGRGRVCVTFVPPDKPAPFSYGMEIVEPYVYSDDGYQITIDAIGSDVPRYDRSLDAIHEVEKTLTGEQTVEYVNQLRLIAERKDDLKTVHWFAVVHMEAAERLETLLRTINIYDNETLDSH